MTQTVKVEKNGVVKSIPKSILDKYITAGWTVVKDAGTAASNTQRVNNIGIRR